MYSSLASTMCSNETTLRSLKGMTMKGQTPHTGHPRLHVPGKEGNRVQTRWRQPYEYTGTGANPMINFTFRFYASHHLLSNRTVKQSCSIIDSAKVYSKKEGNSHSPPLETLHEQQRPRLQCSEDGFRGR